MAKRWLYGCLISFGPFLGWLVEEIYSPGKLSMMGSMFTLSWCGFWLVWLLSILDWDNLK